MSWKLWLAVGASAAAFAAPAFAQDAGGVDTIIVTAQKREQSVQEVPISITAYSGRFIEDSGVLTMQDVALYAPNFTIGSSSKLTNNRIAIRGVGSVGDAGIEPSVGVFIDGVYYPRPGSVIGALLDIDSFEVLRGPQGTLFGRNTAVGALNVHTRDPDFSGVSGRYAIGAGAYDLFSVNGAFNAPLNDEVALRLAAGYTDRGGYGHNDLTDEDFGERDDFNVRGKLLFAPSDATSILFAADYAKINSGGQTIELLTDTANPVMNATLNALFGPGAANVVTADPYDHRIYQDHRDDLEDVQQGLALTVEHAFASGHVLKSITAARNWEADYFESAIRLPAQLFPRKTDYYNETFSEELQLLSPSGGAFEYVLGAFYYNETYDISQDFDLGAQFCIPVVYGLAGPAAAAGCAAGQQIDASDGEFAQELESYAVFGQGTYRPNEAWAFTLGARFTSENKVGEFSNTVNNPFVIALAVRDNEVLPKTTIDDDQMTYFANASWFPADDVMVFATVSTGYKSGGFNTDGTFPALTMAQRVFAAEESTNYELGVKSRLFNNTVQANVTAYRMDLENFQDRAFDSISFITRNVGELRQQGVEADLIWAPIDPLTVSSGLSYLDSEFLDYQNASPLPGGPVQDLTGGRAHFSPDWSDTLGAGGLGYFLRGEMQYVGEQNIGGNTNNNPQSIQDAYALFNARVGLSAPDDRWRLTLWGKNLTEEGYCTVIFDQPFGAQLGGQNAAANTIVQRCAVGAPQTWGLELAIRH